MSGNPGYAKGIGRWTGAAEVYSGEGVFLGNASDTRNVQDLGNGQVRIDLSFIGPLMLSGHYIIENHGEYRLYQGPANVGFAEALSDKLVSANAYWAHWGLSQRFFMMIDPEDKTQMSLALMSRGEQVIATIVGEYYRQSDETGAPFVVPPEMLISGTAYDFKDDPAAGRKNILLHRPGKWHGHLTLMNAQRDIIGSADYSEDIQAEDSGLAVSVEGGYLESRCHYSLRTNQWQAWTPAGEVVGTYSLSGGRALSGQFHFLDRQLRVWRREVSSFDGRRKAVLHFWYRGDERVAIQYGWLDFDGSDHE